jgi:transcriptional regulator with XRE-family HTH domain
MPDSLTQRISLLIKAKRRENGDLTVREAAKEAKISAATFSRLGSGKSDALPDLATLKKLANWLGTTIDNLIGSEMVVTPNEIECTTPEIVEVHLRADKNLSPETAKALATMFTEIYNNVSKNRSKT